MKVDLNSNQTLRVVLIGEQPAILLTHAGHDYRFRHTATMDMEIARLVFFRMKQVGSVNLDYFEHINHQATSNFYLISKSNVNPRRQNKVHLWNALHSDTHCHLWSNGKVKNYEIHHEIPEDHEVCGMCQMSLEKLNKKLALKAS